jgi:hypothetical protein
MSTVDTDTEEKRLSLFDAVLGRGAAIVLAACLVFWMAVGAALYFIL